jgi:hypothetical protein
MGSIPAFEGGSTKISVLSLAIFLTLIGPEEELESEVPVAAHARRASAVSPGRFLQNPPPLPESHHERGTNLLRRLSLSSALAKVSLLVRRDI